MSGLLFGGVLLAVVAAWIVIARAAPAAPPRVALLVTVVAPTVLFSSIVAAAFAGSGVGEYRVALEGFSANIGTQEAITVGGGTAGEDADDLIVADLPPGYLTIRPDGNRLLIELPPALDGAGEDPAYAAVRVSGGTAPRPGPFANTIRLTDLVDPVIVTSDTNGFRVDPRRHTIAVTPTTAIPIPQRSQEIFGVTVPLNRNLPADVSMFPLRYLARATEADDAVTNASGTPLGSFLSWDGGYLRKNLFLTLVGDGTSVRHRGGTITYDRHLDAIGEGESRRVALFRLDYAVPGAEARNRAQERRSFRVSFANGRVDIVFDTPEIIRLSAASFNGIDPQQDGSRLLVVRNPHGGMPLAQDQMQLSFPQLGSRIQNELYAMIRVAPPDCSLRVTSHTGERCYRFGDGFLVGDNMAALLRITNLPVPTAIMATMAILGVFGWLWVTRHQADAVAVIVVSAAETMLAVRLLIALAGGVVDSGAASALWESVVAYALLPSVLRIAWWYRSDPAAWRSYLPMIVPPAVLSGLVLVRAGVAPRWIVVSVATALLAPLGAAVVAPRAIAFGHRWLGSVPRLLVFAGIVVSLRALVLILAGWKERASVGTDLALSVVYLPATFFFCAAVWQWYRTLPDQPRWRRLALPLGGIGVAACALMIGVPALVRDVGAVLVYTPAVLLLLAVPIVAARTWRPVLLAVPLLLMIGGHLFALTLPWALRGPETEADDARYRAALGDSAQADAYLSMRLDHDTNSMRTNSLIAPHRLEQAGTSRASGLVTQRRILDRYTGQGWFGIGYLQVPLSYFRDTHLNDNLSAIHILAPFGAFGALGLMGVLVALAIIPVQVWLRSLPPPAQASPATAIDAPVAAGILALWTFSFASLYMIAANVGLVLFTGKNVYLLAAASMSDALEGGLLLLFALLALGPAPGTTVASQPQALAATVVP